MMKGKPNLIFGNDGVLPTAADLRAGSKQNPNMQKARQAAGSFASYLQSETKGPAMPAALASSGKGQDVGAAKNLSNPVFQSPKGPNLPARTQIQKDAPQAAAAQVDPAVAQAQREAVVKGVSTRTGGRYAFGMEDTRPGVRNLGGEAPGKGRVPAGSLNRGFTPNEGTMGRALQSTSTPLKTLNTMPEALKAAQATAPAHPAMPGGPSETPDMGISNSTPLRGEGIAIGGSKSAVLALHTNTHRKPAGPMNFDYSFTSGQETKNLLQAFKKAELTLKKSGVAVAEAPYRTPFVTTSAKNLPAKGAAAAGYTGAYAASQKTAAQTIAENKAQKTQAGKASVQNAALPIVQAPGASATGYNGELGSLSAKFESGDMGIAAIGYDRHGGTSYGKYQISSRAGTMRNFISYLKDNAPDLAERLSKAGPANTGSRSGRMPTVWRAIATEQPERFENLQSDFIKRSHFEPALTSLTDVGGVSYEALPAALKEVVFSTAVQHGPAGAAKIIDRAVGAVGMDKLRETLVDKAQSGSATEQELIRNIYAIRSRQFGSSSGRVQAAVKSRLRQEMQDVLSLLKETRDAQKVAGADDGSAKVAAAGVTSRRIRRMG